jgi:adenylyltransferase/sulfurtransferase
MSERYKRQILIPEINSTGQEKLAASRVLVAGAGGLGSPALYYLAAAGIGHIHIIDSDCVEMSNLNRQFIHFEEDIHREKAISAKEKLTRFNSEISVTSAVMRLDEENVEEAIKGFDIVVSCVDNLQTRILLNKGCVSSHIPMVDGGVRNFTGYILTVLPGITPCYQCIFPRIQQSTAPVGVLGAVPGVVGSIMAVQVIKYLLGMKEGFDFLVIDLKTLNLTSLETRINPQCPVCRNRS